MNDTPSTQELIDGASANEVSDETGQFDPRFLLWRKFCDDHGVAVNSLPSDLSGETRRLWEAQKKLQTRY